MALVFVDTIRLRRRDKADWFVDDPILDEGELVVEKDTGKLKLGNGVSRYSVLSYFIPEGDLDEGELLEHINSPSPHPIYDDGPSLFLLYQNAKV